MLRLITHELSAALTDERSVNKTKPDGMVAILLERNRKRLHMYFDSNFERIKNNEITVIN